MKLAADECQPATNFSILSSVCTTLRCDQTVFCIVHVDCDVLSEVVLDQRRYFR